MCLKSMMWKGVGTDAKAYLRGRVQGSEFWQCSLAYHPG